MDPRAGRLEGCGWGTRPRDAELEEGVGMWPRAVPSVGCSDPFCQWARPSQETKVRRAGGTWVQRQGQLLLVDVSPWPSSPPRQVGCWVLVRAVAVASALGWGSPEVAGTWASSMPIRAPRRQTGPSEAEASGPVPSWHHLRARADVSGGGAVSCDSSSPVLTVSWAGGLPRVLVASRQAAPQGPP